MKKTKFLMIAVYFIIGYSITVNAQAEDSDAFYMGCGTNVFFEAEVMPTPVDGVEKLLKNLNASFKLQRHEKGNFLVDIQMNCRGQTRNIQIHKSEFSYLMNEKLDTFFWKVKFNPAKQRGRAVNCNFQYLISYKKGTFTEAKIQLPEH